MEFVCHKEPFQCTHMPFGLKIATACFQLAVDLILTKYNWKTCLVHIDDFIIFSRNLDDDITHVFEIKPILADTGVMLKINKFHF